MLLSINCPFSATDSYARASALALRLCMRERGHLFSALPRVMVDGNEPAAPTRR